MEITSERLGDSVVFHFLRIRFLAAKRICIIIGLRTFGYNSMPIFRMASSFLGRENIPVQDDIHLKTAFQKLVREGQSHRM